MIELGEIEYEGMMPTGDEVLTLTMTDPALTIEKAISEAIDEDIREAVLKVTRKVGVNINEEALILALQQDRTRYERAYRKGWEAGKEKALQKIREFMEGEEDNV